MRIAAIIVALLITTAPLFAQAVDTPATVVCGKSEQSTPCLLILNRSVPSYELTVKKGDSVLLSFKAERVEKAWQVLGEKRNERIIEVIVDVKDASYVVVNPRLPYISEDLVPNGCEGLIIKTVEIR